MTSGGAVPNTPLEVGQRIAAIDIGTNTVLLTIAERVEAGDADLGSSLRVVEERHAITRLGEGVDERGVLMPVAVSRTLECLRDYAQSIRDAGAVRVRCVGTSALRDAGKNQAFISQAGALLACQLEVVSGIREAALTYRGALSSLEPSASKEDLVLAFDIGGGSTEVALGLGGEVTAAVSVDVGSVRLFERHARDPLRSVQATVSRTVERAVDNLTQTAVQRSALPAPQHRAATQQLRVIGIAGTMTTLWSLEHRLGFSEDAARSRPLARAAIERLASELHSMPLAERRDRLGIDEGRADVIPYGAVIAFEVLRAIDAEMTHVTGRGVRYGLLLEMAASTS